MKKNVLKMIAFCVALIMFTASVNAQYYYVNLVNTVGSEWVCELIAVEPLDVSVYLNGSVLYFDTQPRIVNGRTMVPMRTIFEMMGAKVEWDETNKTINAYKNNGEIKLSMQIGNFSMTKNDVVINLDVAPSIIDGRTFVPLAAIAQGFGASVMWFAPDAVIIELPAVDRSSMVPLFSPDGRVAFLPYNDKQRYINVGWFETPGAAKIKLFNIFGQAVSVFKKEVDFYKSAGWHDRVEQVTTKMYSMDKRMIIVFNCEVDAYKAVGWYDNFKDVSTVLYSTDNRTITVYKSEVEAYIAVGWYATYDEAMAAAKKEGKSATVSNSSEVKDRNGRVLKVGNTVKIYGMVDYFLAEITAISNGKIEVYTYDYIDFLSGRSILNTASTKDISLSAMIAGVRLNSRVWIAPSNVILN